MTDTEPDVARKFYEMIMARSGEERFMMGIRSFEAARAMVLSSLPRNLSEEELGKKLFERIYGASLEEFLKASSQPNENCP